MQWKRSGRGLLCALLVIVGLAAAFYFGGETPEDLPSAVVRTETQTDAASEDQAPSLSATAPSAELSQETESSSESEFPQAPADEDGSVGAFSQEEHAAAEDPAPDESQSSSEQPQDNGAPTAYTCTISISCATILDNLDACDPEKLELVPEDGWILEPVSVTFYEGESVFHVLQRTCKQQKIHMEYAETPIYNSVYIEGIHNLYEFDVGELSGWMYKVNDWFPNYGCSRYQLQDGDTICWIYSCELGRDIGGDGAAGNARAA